MIRTSFPIRPAYLIALPRRNISSLPNFGANASLMYQDEVFLPAARINELRESRLDLLDEHPFPVQCVTHAADCNADRSPRLSRVFGITRFTGYQPRDDGVGDVVLSNGWTSYPPPTAQNLKIAVSE